MSRGGARPVARVAQAARRPAVAAHPAVCRRAPADARGMVTKRTEGDSIMRRWGTPRAGMERRPRGTTARRPREGLLVLLALGLLLAIVLTVLFVVAPAH